MRVGLFIGLILIAFSCKKVEEPVANYGAHHFYFNGNKNGEELKIAAGENNYYMFTSKHTDQSGAEHFVGKLSTVNCPNANCGEAVIIDFKGPAKEPIENIVSDKRVDFTIREPKMKYGVQFNAEETFVSQAAEVKYRWSFADEGVTKEAKPYHFFEADKEYYDVKLQVIAKSQIQSEIKNRIYTNPECKTWFEFVKEANGSKLVAHHRGGKASQYYWEFEDGTSASVPELDYEYNPTHGSERVCLTITDEFGCKSQYCQNVVVDENYADYAANYKFDLEEVQPKNGFEQYKTVLIKYVDPTGEVYYSDPVNQQQSVSIKKIEDYSQTNEKGEKVKRIEFVLSCTLQSESGKTIELSNINGALGVAY